MVQVHPQEQLSAAEVAPKLLFVNLLSHRESAYVPTKMAQIVRV